jgi:hypothetical protein
MTKRYTFDKFERYLIVMALEYYILNKQPDPVAGGVPYKEDMQYLFAKLFEDRADG